eukprot:TRINITY_DN7442_c0_g1_i1.p1 TRINITY_DN7442_c0_g1~~TRINITY_DN7442_c0_g1_i1.p1  ORF type:complete len:474 (-),score=119.48 TRINITY_DN7442_c0_g1_i1:34-1455(-)
MVTCALALSIKDFVVAEKSLLELKKFDGMTRSTDYYSLLTCFAILQGNLTQARNNICKAIHLYPASLPFWNKLNQVLTLNSADAAASMDTLILSNLSRNLSPSSAFFETQPSIGNANKPFLSYGAPYSSLLKKDFSAQRFIELARSNLIFGKDGAAFNSKTAVMDTLNAVYRCIHQNPNHQDAYFLLGLALHSKAVLWREQQAWRAAEAAFSLAIRKFDGDSRDSAALVHLECGLSDSILGQTENPRTKDAFAAAERARTRAGKDSKNLAIAMRQVARCHASAGDKDKALKSYKECLRVNASDALTWMELAQYYESQGQLEAAEATLKKISAHLQSSQDPNVPSAQHFAVLIRLAKLLYDQRRFKEALEPADQALSIYPDNAQALFMKGLLVFKSNGELAFAEENLQRSLTLDPSSPNSNYYLGLVHFQFQDYQVAESDFLYEKDINPSEAVNYQLERIAKLLNREPEKKEVP